MTFGRARVRLTLWYAATFFVVLGLLGAGTYFGVTRTLDDQLDEGIESSLAQWEATAPDPRDLPPIFEVPLQPFDNDDTFLLVFRADGALVANPRGANSELFDARGAPGARPSQRTWETVSAAGTTFRLLVEPLRRDEVIVGTAIVGRSRSPRDAEVRNVAVVLVIVAGLGLTFSVGGGYLLAGRALRPLAEASERQRIFVADASHELRSPLALIRLSADLLLREQLELDQREAVVEMRDVADEASRLIDQLLELARLESAPVEGGPQEPLDLAEAAQTEVDRLAGTLTAHGTSVALGLQPARALITADEAHRIVRALLENVLAHTPSGTAVSVTTRAAGGRALLVVEDNGPGVPAGLRPDIFDRFVRADTARTPGVGAGSGLGLAIVRAIATRRGGAAVAGSAASGGLRIEVGFPIAE